MTGKGGSTMSVRSDRRVLRIGLGAVIVAVVSLAAIVVAYVACPLIRSSDTCNAMPLCGMGKVDGLHWGCEAQWPPLLRPDRWR